MRKIFLKILKLKNHITLTHVIMTSHRAQPAVLPLDVPAPCATGQLIGRQRGGVRGRHPVVERAHGQTDGRVYGRQRRREGDDEIVELLHAQQPVSCMFFLY